MVNVDLWRTWLEKAGNSGALSQNCEDRLAALSFLSARPSAWNNPVPTRRIFMKCDTEFFFSKICIENSSFIKNPTRIPLDFSFWGWMKSEIYKLKGEYGRGISRSLFGCSCPHKRNVKTSSDEQHTIFAHELQSALSLTMGFSKVYCEL